MVADVHERVEGSSEDSKGVVTENADGQLDDHLDGGQTDGVVVE